MSVRAFVCLYVGHGREPYKTAKANRRAIVKGLRNHGVHMGTTWRIRLNYSCLAAMLLPLYYTIATCFVGLSARVFLTRRRGENSFKIVSDSFIRIYTVELLSIEDSYSAAHLRGRRPIVDVLVLFFVL